MGKAANEEEVSEACAREQTSECGPLSAAVYEAKLKLQLQHPAF